MPRLSAERIAGILERVPVSLRPKVFVETGTYYAERAVLAAGLFREVHSIEISPELHARAVKEYGHLGIQFHLGDSAQVLPTLCPRWAEPVLFYLDAHWFAVPLVGGDPERSPLGDELAAIAGRPYPDVVLVDDARDFGRQDPPLWKDVTLPNISAHFPGCQAHVVYRDHAVVYR